MKPRFRLGDYVEVIATTVSSWDYQSNETDYRKDKRFKVLKRDVLKEPVCGWIVGMVRRCEGKLHDSYSYEEQSYLERTGSKLLWKVAQSYANTPLEVADEDVKLVPVGSLAERPLWPPLYRGTPWNDPQLQAEQREVMKEAQRDSRGRWLPTPPVSRK